MILAFQDKKFEKECQDEKLLRRHHGAQRAKLLQRRLAQLRAAPTLAALWPPYSGPARCHELSSNLRGFFSVDLDHPYRLLFQPNQNPVPQRPEGGIDWTQITALKILRVEDTHE